MKAKRNSTTAGTNAGVIRPKLTLVPDTRPVPDNRVSLGNYRHAKQVAAILDGDNYKALDQLREQAKRGEIVGFAFAVQYRVGDGERANHQVGATGSYRDDAILFQGAASQLLHQAFESGQA